MPRIILIISSKFYRASKSSVEIPGTASLIGRTISYGCAKIQNTPRLSASRLRVSIEHFYQACIYFPHRTISYAFSNDLILKGKWQCEALLERCSSQRDCKRKPYRITELQRPRVVVPRCQSPLRDYMILKSHGNKKP